MDAPDNSPNFNAARKKHQPGTGSWFLDGPAFTRWKEDPGILLWLHGGPGCGKTVLCAAAIKAVIDFCDSRPSTGYASFFFDGRSAEAALLIHDKLVRSIIVQLAHRCDGIPAALEEMYHNCDQGSRQPPIELLEATLHRIVHSFDSVYIVIDSLDECSERKDVVEWIRSMTSTASGKLHMMATSRSEPDIRRGLCSVVGLEDVSVIGQAIEADIRIFLDARLAGIDDWNEPGLKELVSDSLLGDSDGMFRWVALQLDDLMSCFNRRELERQLKSLPKGLDETYVRILARSSRPKDLRRFLQFLAFSRRAMTVHEIAEVATVDLDTSDLPAYSAHLRYTDPNKVLGICYGLVTEVDAGIIKLAHLSVKEYLISDHILSGAAATFHTDEQLSHSMIAQTSLAYLLHFDKSDSLSKDTLPLFPLARYAAEHWVAHFHSAGSDHGNVAALQQLQLHFFEPSPSHAMQNALHLYDKEVSLEANFDRKVEDFSPPLYYACRSGSTTAVENLVNKGADVNGNRGFLGPPLTAASWIGHVETVQLLLMHGTYVNAKSWLGDTALSTASSRGHVAIVKLLREHGAVEVEGSARPRSSAIDASGLGSGIRELEKEEAAAQIRAFQAPLLSVNLRRDCPGRRETFHLPAPWQSLNFWSPSRGTTGSKTNVKPHGYRSRPISNDVNTFTVHPAPAAT
ncbi:hypothetical protein FIBSPDRAFT_985791 [Athelia psychrophila]|uniref:Uncharacterized protein n=1 Tax=Athelia psychrophila TaxID=1759441 RepID=A0A166B3X0_9AGAM|nr:hypothetical protein FIBSPDRAFT_985791 [Fibularhizoctonia sp. CBS 109695]